ncbi:hypothetical protein C8R41DRAFT_346054 [Lentinula lateritia]|uniref:Uncharacterized protein n=1 Tax=Lentinula lateritia TaxID=40482 RepID=A0ABQ8VGQ1_9AGAR|nr:hypothetical protein C8R41DRAFT_346054 [Lentinula lateritia]
MYTSCLASMIPTYLPKTNFIPSTSPFFAKLHWDRFAIRQEGPRSIGPLLWTSGTPPSVSPEHTGQLARLSFHGRSFQPVLISPGAPLKRPAGPRAMPKRPTQAQDLSTTSQEPGTVQWCIPALQTVHKNIPICLQVSRIRLSDPPPRRKPPWIASLHQGCILAHSQVSRIALLDPPPRQKPPWIAPSHQSSSDDAPELEDNHDLMED